MSYTYGQPCAQIGCYPQAYYPQFSQQTMQTSMSFDNYWVHPKGYLVAPVQTVFQSTPFLSGLTSSFGGFGGSPFGFGASYPLSYGTNFPLYEPFAMSSTMSPMLGSMMSPMFGSMYNPPGMVYGGYVI